MAALTAVALAGCGSDAASEPAAYDGPIGAVDLSQDCPATVVVQTGWNPQAETGFMYHLLGPDPAIDADLKRTSGPLFADGEYTGVDLEIRAGGPAIGFQSVTSQLYQDPDILLGFVDADHAVSNYASTPTISVLAPTEKSPQIIMWDPATYPQARTIADLKSEDVTVLYRQDEPYIDYLTGSGILSPEQVDGSYDGTPSYFVTAGGANAQQGFASSEPYVYENEVEGWKKPVAYELVHDAGFPTYKSTISVRSDRLDETSACLEKLVPVIQRSIVGYLESPDHANTIIVDSVAAYDTGWVYDTGNAAYAVSTMRELGLVDNGPTPALGDFDLERVAELVDILRPIYAAQGLTIPEDLTPEDLVTNEFVDPSVSYTG
ncbi:ABC transporter substrate-binding protein [Rhodococcus triatomae]|nr:ABC transporter substrate-binding protein [Rhodococcus triatomae]QNG25840.1 ABC transporter substrate-binding protein [Rhodococcus triatomae]